MTIKDWFDYLPADVRQKAIANTEAERLNAEFSCLSEAIDKAFNWNESKEGFDYWDKIFMAMLDAPEPRPETKMPQFAALGISVVKEGLFEKDGIMDIVGYKEKEYRKTDDMDFEEQYAE